MIRINLLPHRAEKRRRRKIQFGVLSGLSFALGVLVVGLGYGYLSARIFYQDQRNNYLNGEIAKLDKQIEEIKRLRQQVKALLARKDVVEKLQSTRADVVHLMDQMLRILPQGVYLKTLRQVGDNVSITGYAQSSARVSTLMRAIDESPWLESPQLIEVQANVVNKVRTNEFSMNFKISKAPAVPPATPPTAGGAASSPAAAHPPGAASAPASATPSAAPKVVPAATQAQPAHAASKKR